MTFISFRVIWEIWTSLDKKYIRRKKEIKPTPEVTSRRKHAQHVLKISLSLKIGEDFKTFVPKTRVSCVVICNHLDLVKDRVIASCSTWRWTSAGQIVEWLRETLQTSLGVPAVASFRKQINNVLFRRKRLAVFGLFDCLWSVRKYFRH